MRIVSFNVNGIRAILNKGLIDTLQSLDADIVSFNETKLSDDHSLIFPFALGDYHIFWTNSKIKKGYSGVAVLTKEQPLNVHYGLHDGKYDDEGRIITLEYPHFYYVACYVPNSGDDLRRLPFRLGFEADMRLYLSELKRQKPVIYAGDLNVAHQEIDLKNPSSNHHNAGFTDEERAAFSTLLAEGFIDSFRYLHPQEVLYTWWSYRFQARVRNAGWRIDYFLVCQDLAPLLKESTALTDIMGSDHCPILLEIDLTW